MALAKFLVAFNEDVLNITVEVYNVLGEKIYSQSSISSSAFPIDLSIQPNGVYLYKVLSEDGSSLKSGKLIIAK